MIPTNPLVRNDRNIKFIDIRLYDVRYKIKIDEKLDAWTWRCLFSMGFPWIICVISQPANTIIC